MQLASLPTLDFKCLTIALYKETYSFFFLLDSTDV